ncbi:hypothetical protein PIROE2DRAFT_18067 [Piromyces sp. E2]|nr:hypothetical protein PIROE2DRAFT_18067 [Piromyces sp. E2]|eukprot:OUM57055.1 hypothetical protein PIROE2DRAFT_18067 [Piromyces sp. E2]
MNYKKLAFERLMDGTQNHSLIQRLRWKLFKEVDIPPKKFSSYCLNEEDINENFLFIMTTAETILELLEETKEIYITYFMESGQGLATNVRDLLLPNEAQEYRYDLFYFDYLKKL